MPTRSVMRSFAARRRLVDDDDLLFDEEYERELLTREEKEQEERAERQAEIREELDQKKGRLWTDPWNLDETISARPSFDDLPEWSPNYVSRISQDRVKVLPQKIPTLTELASLALPPAPLPHPGQGESKVYALQRKRAQYRHIMEQVKALAADRIEPIQALESWEEKQDAVDQLFEEIEFELKEKEDILGKHPSFGSWVERALEEYLREMHQEEVTVEETDEDAAATPVFMDCYGPGDSPSHASAKILSPLGPSPNGTVGSMIEEWELAAHKETKRIMLRQCTRAIARALQASSPVRVVVAGDQGAGKSAALAAVVAAARHSGKIVLYLPNGDQMHKNGFYLEPNAARKGIFDLPLLSQNVCKDFLENHKEDLRGIVVGEMNIESFFTADQMKNLPVSDDGKVPIDKLLELGSKKASIAAPCYAIAVDALMKQEEKDFVMVLDEFNCYFQPGHYFHAEYDDAKQPVPYNQISLFKPALDAMAISTETDEETVAQMDASASMVRGAVIVGMTESHAVARKITDNLIQNAKIQASNGGLSVPIKLVNVPRLSGIEVDHMIANYEATGVGKLRLDRGETVMNENEVAYLKMLSGGVAQKLMDACIV